MTAEVNSYWRNFPETYDLLTANLQALTAPMTSSRGLPNITYNDSRLFDFERDQLLGKTWAAIGYGSGPNCPAPGLPGPLTSWARRY